MNFIKNKYALHISAGVCIIAVVAMIFVLATPKKTEKKIFTPPPFESTAVSGTPEVPEHLGYSEIYQEGMSFKAAVCGNVVINSNTADIYFTNTPENKVWMKLRILNKAGDIIAETGLLKPGEYLKSVTFDQIPKNGANIKLKIMTYEPETYYSAGSVTLDTTVTIGGEQ